jgi:hypothetical protein
MRAMIAAYRITVDRSHLLGCPEAFWDALHSGSMLLTAIEGADSDVVHNVVDWLASEHRLQIPTGQCTDIGGKILPPAGTESLSWLTPRASDKLRSRLSKRQIEPNAANRIAEAYGFDRDSPKVVEAEEFLRLLQYVAGCFQTDEQRILVVGHWES